MIKYFFVSIFTDQSLNEYLWIVGGQNQDNVKLNTSEFVYLNKKSVEGPTLNLEFLFGHCMVKLNDSAIFIIGGDNGKITSSEGFLPTADFQTWIVDPTNEFKFTEGPKLNEVRYDSACGKYEDSGKTKLIVAGGYRYGNGEMYSVETLDPSSPNNVWQYGKEIF